MVSWSIMSKDLEGACTPGPIRQIFVCWPAAARGLELSKCFHRRICVSLGRSLTKGLVHEELS